MNYIDLSRRFRDLTDSELESPELLASLNDATWASAAGMSSDWAELLQHPRVLILAEAGSGKTAEMQGQAARLSAEGNLAFFVALEALDREPLTEILSCSQNRELDAWKSEGQTQAWFFLDAVDELKLVQGKLERALNRFANAIDGHLHRAHCVISCRPSDFRQSVDLAIVQAKLPVTSSQSSLQTPSNDAFLAALYKQEHGRGQRAKHGEGPRIVVLLPLSEDQIVAFAGSLGVEDKATLIEEIRRRNAWTFARRPLDLINLVASWKADRRLGTLAQQHEANVAAKLMDSPERPDCGVLSDDRARSGAERLALALALTRIRTIRSPEQALSMERAEGVLDPAEFLTDWTPKERQTLLRRALFDPATYGRVRFHHRSVQEYLAARRLKELRERGMPVKNLHRLLFAELYSVPLVKPSTQSIAAWLALWDDDVRRELMEREPETLLSMGDPESLSIDDRAQLLRTFFRIYGEGGWRGLDIPIDAVRRLADPALAGVVREIWGARPASPDVIELLLDIICQGHIGECVDIARAAALDVNQPSELRVIAIRALVACGDLVSAREIADSILSEPEIWPDRIVRTAVGILFPNALSIFQLIALLKRIPEPKDSGGGFSRVMRWIVESIDPVAEVAVELRDALTDLIWQGRDDKQEWYRPRGAFNHVAPALARLCDRQLDASVGSRNPDDRLIWACVVANRFGDDEVGGHSQVRDLKKHFGVRVDHREAAFWSETRLISELEPELSAQKQLIRAEQGSLLVSLKTADRPWLLEASRCSPDLNRTHRRVALYALLRLWNPRCSDQVELDELTAAIGDDMELAEALRQRSTPPEPDPEHEKWERKARQQELERQRDESEARVKWLQWREELLANPDAAVSGEELRVTTHNLQQWLEAHRGSDFARYNAWDENALRAAFGDGIARRAAEAFQKVWRAHRPTLKSQRPPDDHERTLFVWCEGLTGLAAEAMTPGWAGRLTPDEAQIAAAYATIELNGFPSWLREVAGTHPMAVNEVIGGELTAELANDQGQSYLSTLQNLSQTDISIKRLLAYRLLSWLPNWPLTFQDENCSKQSAHHLGEVLGILAEVAEGQNRATIAEECEQRFLGNPNGPLAETWLRWLFQFSPERATHVLEEVLASVPEQKRSAYAIVTLVSLFGNRGTLLAFPDNRARAATLARLVRCAYAYIRPAEDREHEGSYSPDLRDHAERARNFLLLSLLDTPGPEAQRAIHDLAVDPIFAHFPERLLLLARRRAASDADSPVFSPEDVVALEKRFEAPPHDRDGLFAVMIDRLDDLAHDLAHHEFTNRRTLQTISDEAEMQRNLARSLLDTARGAYKVSREEEVADRKRTDIRLAATHGDQKAVIEVKIADERWSLTQLEDALRNQLVGQYLRHNMCKAGCLLLVYNGRKKDWRCSRTRKRLTFPAVVEHLRSLATGIESDMNNEVLLGVFPLDLTEPLNSVGQ